MKKMYLVNVGYYEKEYSNVDMYAEFETMEEAMNCFDEIKHKYNYTTVELWDVDTDEFIDLIDEHFEKYGV